MLFVGVPTIQHIHLKEGQLLVIDLIKQVQIHNTFVLCLKAKNPSILHLYIRAFLIKVGKQTIPPTSDMTNSQVYTIDDAGENYYITDLH